MHGTNSASRVGLSFEVFSVLSGEKLFTRRAAEKRESFVTKLAPGLSAEFLRIIEIDQVGVQRTDARLGAPAKKGARKIGRLAHLDYELCLVNVLVDVLASTRDNAITGFLVQFETHLAEILVSLGQDAAPCS
jgi:hypothetical protein